MATSLVPHVTIFIDTNVFIHLRDLKDLPWKDEFPKLRTLTIMVASRVIEELDDFKVGQSKRKRDRARSALKMIKQSVRNDDGRVVLREKPFKIYLQVPEDNRVDWERLPKLDSSKPDDHLIAEAYTYGRGAIIFSHDSGPVISALRMGLEALEPEGEKWFLTAQPSQNEIKIRQLQRQLELAEATSPTIMASFGSQEYKISDFKLVVPILKPLEPRIAQKLSSSFLRVHPPHHIPVRSGLLVGSVFSNNFTQSDKSSYDADYSRFTAIVKKYFETLHDQIAKASRAQALPYFVHNDSPVAAQGLRIDVSISGECYLAAGKDEADGDVGSLSLPKAPNMPEKGMGLHQGLSHFNIPNNKPRDPTGFFWEKRPNFGEQTSAVQCADFRATELRKSCAWMCSLDEPPVSGRISLKVSASNMRAPVEFSVPFELSKQEVSWDDERVHRRLPKALSDFLRSEV